LPAGFNPRGGRGFVVPTRRGKRGNPVLWAKRFIPEMAELAGDVGAKHLIGERAELVCEVEMDTDGVLVDIDTPDALAAFRDKVKPTAAQKPSPAQRERVAEGKAGSRVRVLRQKSNPHPPTPSAWAPPSPAMRERGFHGIALWIR